MIQGIIEPLAGKDTQIHANIALGTIGGVSIAINLFQVARGSSRKKTIERQRDRMDELEARIGIEVGG